MRARGVQSGPPLWALLFLAALLLRGGWVCYQWTRGGPALEFDDERLHWQLATHLVRDGALISDDGRQAARMPLYSFYLALFAPLGNTGILAARLGQALLGAMTVGLVYAFAKSVFGARGALLAGLLACFDPFGVFFTNLLLSETLFTTIAAALTFAAWHVVARNREVEDSRIRGLKDSKETAPPEPEISQNSKTSPPQILESSNPQILKPVPTFPPSHVPTPSHRRALSLGVAMLGAAAILTRESAVAWIPCLWLALLVFDHNRWRGLRRTAFYAAFLFGCLLPWAWRNSERLGGWVWLSANGGATLYDAQGPQADGRSDQTFLKELPKIQNLGELERDRALRELALEQMRRDPLRVPRLAWTKFLRMWSLTPNVESYRGGFTAMASAGFTLLLLAGAAGGLWRGGLSPKNRPTTRETPPDANQSKIQNPKSKIDRAAIPPRAPFFVLVFLPVVCFTLLHCVFIGSVRYRVPLTPFLALAAAGCVSNKRNQSA